MSADAWRPQIALVVREIWPQLQCGVDWITAQVHVESRGNAAAKSPVGALGLLQLMPGTADEMGVTDALDPEQNLRGGVKYLRIQYDHMGEIPTEEDRLFWAFACYNGGRGYVNKALKLAHGDGEVEAWKWDVGRRWLSSAECIVNGRHPDAQQMVDYVSRIRAARGQEAA